jgi:hypothetical protein
LEDLTNISRNVMTAHWFGIVPRVAFWWGCAVVVQLANGAVVLSWAQILVLVFIATPIAVSTVSCCAVVLRQYLATKLCHPDDVHEFTRVGVHTLLVLNAALIAFELLAAGVLASQLQRLVNGS